ncbi:TetR/AcrR family transcriptional regulator [Shewanella sp. GXUN23E]|uniref:TetR/AcrR family transcriptional regulator n=1 Tax=Shewanella sp. GXUN23E TaxID=3422498 RepID=UPI003D7E3241
MNRSDLKRLAILDAAQAEFLAQGFEGANTDRISQLACVSKRTLYRHFGNKQGLFKAVLSRLHAASHQADSVSIAPGQPLKPQLLKQLKQEVIRHDATYNLSVLRMIVVELLRQPEMAKAMLEEVYAQKDSLGLWVQQALAAGALRGENPELMARMLKGMFSGMVVWPALLSGEENAASRASPRVLDEIATVFCRAYASDTRPD